MPHLIDSTWLLLGLVLLYVGGEWLVRGARGGSLKMGITPLVVGLTVVAFGTSAPELLVSLQANLQGKGDMALGNVVGSNICNIALILGVGAAIRPMAVDPQILKRELPILLAISIIFVALLLQDDSISQWEGALFFIAVVTYSTLSIRRSRTEAQNLSRDSILTRQEEPDESPGDHALLPNIGFILLGIGALVYGADRLVLGGSNIARNMGVPEATIALTVVAFGTSLPELATSIVAALRRQGDILIGNAVGSCIFNILCVVGLTSTIAPLGRTDDLRNMDLWVMLTLTLILFPFLWSRRSLARGEGALLLAGYGGYVCYLALR